MILEETDIARPQVIMNMGVLQKAAALFRVLPFEISNEMYLLVWLRKT